MDLSQVEQNKGLQSSTLLHDKTLIFTLRRRSFPSLAALYTTFLKSIFALYGNAHFY